MISYSLLLYLSLTWVAMAPMNIAEWIFNTLLLIYLFKTKKLPLSQSEKNYFNVTLLMSSFFILSIFVYSFAPLQIDYQVAQPQTLRGLLKQIYFFLPILIAWGLKLISESELKKIAWLAVLVFTALSLICFQQYWTGFPLKQDIPGVDNRYHAIGFLGHHLSLASIWIFPTFFILDLSRTLKLPENKKRRLYFSAALGFIVLFLSYSRMAWIATSIGALVYFLFSIKSIRNKLISLSGFIVGLVVLMNLPLIQNRIHQAIGIRDRMDLWRVHWELFKYRPITGVGFLQGQDYSGLYQIAEGRADVFAGHAHNVVLEILSSTGVLGLLGYLVWMIYLCMKFYNLRKLPGVLGIGVAWIVFLLNGLTQVNFLEGKVMHQMAWCIAVLLFLESRRDQQK
ncbi:MAG: O-antigen ligase family protein [Xanthomonadaceae bacterium]|nr:O-antigen ligase family protein [Xanthomonadaceae bacterium]